MRIVRLAVALLLPLALLSSCGDDDDDAADADDGATEPTSLVFHAEDAGSTAKVVVGDTFDVVLEQCIGCGYTWQLQTNGEPAAFGDEDIVTMVGEEDIRRGESEDEDGNPIVGGAADHVVHFRANAAGGINVDLAYIGPGKTEPDSADDEFILTVEVSAS